MSNFTVILPFKEVLNSLSKIRINNVCDKKVCVLCNCYSYFNFC